MVTLPISTNYCAINFRQAEASEALLQELADKDPTFRKVTGTGTGWVRLEDPMENRDDFKVMLPFIDHHSIKYGF